MLCSNFIPTSTMGTSDRRAQTQFIVALWCLVVAVLTDPVPGLLGTAWGAATMIDDTSVNQAIESRLLMDPEVSAHLIDVDIHDGIASLSGKVGTLLEKERAISIAESIKGVRSVIDRIDVSPNARNDSAIQGDIEHTLRQDRVTRPYQVDVSVREGVVTLSGKVPSWGISRLAARAASRTAGVKRIVNQINVSTQTARRDSDIEKEVRNRLRFDLYVDDSLVDIKVENGEVSLSGIVGSAAERSRARRLAMINGVRDVDDEALAVEWRRANQMRKNRKYTPLPDQRVEKAVADALLYDPRINSANPDIHVRNGMVTLSGIVDNYEAKRSAEQDARNTAGVWRVQNRLKVRYQNWPQDDMVESNILRVFERDAVLGGYAIEAHVKNHLAVLTGVVDTMGQKIQAETIAGQVNGVVAVQNSIRVNRQWQWKSDRAIGDDVKDELFWSPFVDSDQIRVSVKDGHVTLTGVVSDAHEGNLAVKNAFEGGAKSVRTGFKTSSGDDYRRYYSNIEDFFRYDDAAGYPYWP